MKNRLEDVSSVKDIVNRYVEGSGGDVDLLRSIFHPEALMTGYFGGQLMVGSPEPFFQGVAQIDPSQASGEYRAEIQDIEVIGDVATATLVETNFLGSDFVDFFQFIRADGEWKIISKTFHQAN